MEFLFFLLYPVPLGIPDKTKLHPQNFHEMCYLHLSKIWKPSVAKPCIPGTLEIHSTCFLFPGNSMSFLINPWKFYLLFLQYPWKFHILNSPLPLFLFFSGTAHCKLTSYTKQGALKASVAISNLPGGGCLPFAWRKRERNTPNKANLFGINFNDEKVDQRVLFTQHSNLKYDSIK